MREAKLFREFFNSEKTGGLVVVLSTILPLTLANSAVQTWLFRIYGNCLVFCALPLNLGWKNIIGAGFRQYWYYDVNLYTLLAFNSSGEIIHSLKPPFLRPLL